MDGRCALDQPLLAITHPANPPSQPTLSTHPLNNRYQLPSHPPAPSYPPFQPTFSIHPHNPPSQRSLTTLLSPQSRSHFRRGLQPVRAHAPGLSQGAVRTGGVAMVPRVHQPAQDAGDPAHQAAAAGVEGRHVAAHRADAPVPPREDPRAHAGPEGARHPPRGHTPRRDDTAEQGHTGGPGDRATGDQGRPDLSPVLGSG